MFSQLLQRGYLILIVITLLFALFIAKSTHRAMAHEVHDNAYRIYKIVPGSVGSEEIQDNTPSSFSSDKSKTLLTDARSGKWGMLGEPIAARAALKLMGFWLIVVVGCWMIHTGLEDSYTLDFITKPVDIVWLIASLSFFVSGWYLLRAIF